MKIKDSDRNLRCEMPNCKNMAKFKVEKDGFFRSAGIYLWGDCASEMYKVLSTKFVPKSPENICPIPSLNCSGVTSIASLNAPTGSSKALLTVTVIVLSALIPKNVSIALIAF